MAANPAASSDPSQETAGVEDARWIEFPFDILHDLDLPVAVGRTVPHINPAFYRQGALLDDGGPPGLVGQVSDYFEYLSQGRAIGASRVFWRALRVLIRTGPPQQLDRAETGVRDYGGCRGAARGEGLRRFHDQGRHGRRRDVDFD